MKTSFTPGPWEVYTDNHYDEVLIQNKDCVVVDRVGTLVSNNATDNARLMADATLIAAAPDLLDALSYVLSRLTYPEQPNTQMVLYSDSLAPNSDEETIVDYLQSVIRRATK